MHPGPRPEEKELFAQVAGNCAAQWCPPFSSRKQTSEQTLCHSKCNKETSALCPPGSLLEMDAQGPHPKSTELESALLQQSWESHLLIK